MSLFTKRRKSLSMKQEDKELILVDLCARLPYNTKVRAFIGEKGECDEILGCVHILNFYAYNCKPYLRTMSSMTEEEEIYYNTVYTALKFYEKEDWLNANHFDYRGLIPMNLALEAPKGMYN